MRKALFALSYVLCIMSAHGEVHGDVIKAVIFDVDSLTATVGKRSDIEDYIKKTLQLNQKEYEDALIQKRNGRPKSEEEELAFWKKYAKENKKNLPEDWVLQYEKIKERILLSQEAAKKMFKVVADIKASNIKTALLADVSPLQVQVIKRSPFASNFDQIVFLSEDKPKEADIRCMALTAEKLDVAATSCLFIGKNVPDIEAAKAAGMETFSFENIDQCMKELKNRQLVK